MTEFFKWLAEHLDDFAVNLMSSWLWVIIVSIFTLLFPTKNRDHVTGNQSTLQQVTNYYYNILVVKIQPTSYSKTTKQISTQDTFLLFLVALAGAVIIYIRFHSIILDSFASFIIIAFLGLLIFVIKQYRNNSLDGLNRFWAILGFVILLFDLIQLFIMSSQDFSDIKDTGLEGIINNKGIDGFMELGYIALGFFSIIVPNTILLVLFAHMFFFNVYRATGWGLARRFITKTHPFTTKPYFMATFCISVCLVSIIFSSGLAFQWLKNYQETIYQLYQ
ncbi:hypothetical protein [Parageobacillus thermoglucosidasius]|uniref:Uncharacterized protein n=1 Tax=Parageobacillus thermoglucosidasius TaxID=1426 RepID=A0AB38QZJ4_PARTM|nr:hypothetical protein [Parageobacillus thermoglucosidasius]UOE76118.1 hypothetical protein IMI45_17945 [Parageobacillus thermoglucosidasius]